MKIFSLCLTAVFLFTWCKPAISQSDITLEGIWRFGMFNTEQVEGFRFMNDGRHYSRLVDGEIKMYDIESADWVADILTSEDLGEEIHIDGYSFSEDESLILFYTNKVSQYRRSFFADYYVWDTDNKTLKEVGEEQGQMNGHLSPCGNRVGFVYENDLYFRDLQSGELTRITEEGERNKIINGASDWVYEEEFYLTRAFEWSPDASYLAYLRFDESPVREFTMTDYTNSTYPDYTTFKYPKVGEENAELSVWAYDIESEGRVEVRFDMEDFYIPRIHWTPDQKLVIFTMNRHQNELILWLADPLSGEKEILLKEVNPYYINLHDNLTFLEEREQFIWTSEKDGYNHVYLYDMDGNLLRQLTKGAFDVTDFYGVDKERELVFFQAAAQSPLNREIYSVPLDGGNMEIRAGEEGVNKAAFSSTFDYYILEHSTANQPPRHAVYDIGGDEIRLIEGNEILIEIQEELGLSSVEFFSFTTSEKVTLNGYTIFPPDFDEEKKYPVLMYQYSGPNSQHAINSWRGENYWWFQLLSRKGYIIACVDGRGTGARGQEFRKMTYMNLGHYETLDQIETARYLGAKDYVDETRIGIFGWSYGGYISTLCILKGSDVFSSAIAVAPVTDWRWYDTIYTERYMRTYEENREGYTGNSAMHFAHQLEGDFLIVHGLADDNVHFQHTAEMVRMLNFENKHYDLYIYPNNNHSIRTGSARYHLYTKMTEFILSTL
nr:S9 family peptidase [Saprospiraceae bacterium]